MHKVAEKEPSIRRQNYETAVNFLKYTPEGRKALRSIAPAEILYTGAGSIAGGLGGWVLAKLLHKKPSAKLKLLYALGGAAAGGLGVNSYLSSASSIKDFEGSKRDELRLAPKALDLLSPIYADMQEALPGEEDKRTLSEKLSDMLLSKRTTIVGGATLAGGGLGLRAGSSKWYKEMLRRHNNWVKGNEALKTFLADKVKPVGGSSTDTFTNVFDSMKKTPTGGPAAWSAPALDAALKHHGLRRKDIKIYDFNGGGSITYNGRGRLNPFTRMAATKWGPSMLAAAITGGISWLSTKPGVDGTPFSPKFSPQDLARYYNQSNK